MILLYHKVHPESKTCWWVDVEAFYRQMLALRGRKVVYLDDYNLADPKQVVITFDGIYKNVLEYAAPFLEEFGYPFELFVTSAYVGRDNAFDTVEPPATFVDEAELATLVAMGGRLQWHSRTHINLGRVMDRQRIRSELDMPESLRRLDPSGFRWFAYPHGDFNDLVVEEVRARFVGGLSCIQGNDCDRFVLNRQIVTNDTVIEPCGRVAVIIASYNYGCYLPEAVESVLRQTRLPDEIHIVDDCSEDNTEEIGRYFAGQHPGQIEFHRNAKNLGIVQNFNNAVSRIRSDYICILGADNRMRSDYIERLAALLDTHPDVAIAYTDFALFGPRARVIYDQFPSEQQIRVILDHFYVISFPDFTLESRQQLEHGNFMHGSSMFRRDAYEQVGGYLKEDGVPEDYNLFLRMVRIDWGAIRCPFPLLEYRQHSREQANIRLSTHAEAQCYRKMVGQRDGQIAKLTQAISERDGQIAAMKASRSWRITRPFRFIRRGIPTLGQLRQKPLTLVVRELISRAGVRIKLLRWYCGLMRCPLFDQQWYLAQNPDVSQANINPLWHYLVHGWRENRKPGPTFDGEYYRARYPDLADLDLPPLLHYWRYGRHEGRHINPPFDPECMQSDLYATKPTTKIQPEASQLSAMGLTHTQNATLISVIIPTYNRIKLLPGIIDSWRKVHSWTSFNYEIIFSDDGSSDGSVEYLESVKDLPLRVLRNVHGGASSARNAAIRAACGERLLIIGDDIFPDKEILNVHVRLAQQMGPKVAILGTVNWHDDLAVNHLMHHITEIGNEQFSYNRLKDGSYVDFRHFYTCNISVDRHFLLEEKVIFDERFDAAAFEDIELGYRLSHRGMRLFYTTQANGSHYHPYTAEGFCRRQASCGRMAVVFCNIHPIVTQILSVDAISRHARRNQKPSSQNALWQSRVDMLVRRCEEYERLVAVSPQDVSMGIAQCLSCLYSRLFRAMYEYGVLDKLGSYPNALAISMDYHFEGPWAEYWTLLAQNIEQSIDLNAEETYNLAEALSAGNSADLFFGPEQRAVFDELMQVKSLALRGHVGANSLKQFSRKFSRVFYYLINDPRHLVYRAKQVFPLAIDRQRTKRLPSTKPTLVATALPALVIEPGDTNREEAIALFHATFGDGALLYERIHGNLLIPQFRDGRQREPVMSSAVEATIFFWPTSTETMPLRDHLLSAYMALVENGLNVAVISHNLVLGPTVWVGALRDHILFSRDVAETMFNSTLGKIPLKGKILRLLPASGAIQEQKLEVLMGGGVDIDDDGFFFSRSKGAVAGIRYKAPYLPPRSKQKPVVFVFPIFLAVGGVERNTIEIMRTLSNRFDFVLITMERLRPEQGNLAAQAIDAEAEVIELPEIVRHVDYLRVLIRLKANLLPDLIWVCNGSPWFCDNAGAIRQIFHDVPIIDQEVYDVEQGWITRYGEAGIRSFDRFIAINKKIEERFRRDFGIDPARIHLIYHAVDASRIRRFKQALPNAALLKAKYGLPADKQIFTFVGRLTPQKRPLEFLRLAKKRLAHAGEYFVLIGNGELSSEVQTFISQHELKNVTRIPYIENIFELHAVSDGIMFTSAYEGLPIAMIEALAMGVPTFATDVGDIADVLAEYGGGVVVPVNLSDECLHEAFIDWLGRRSEYARNLLKYEHAILERFSSENIAQQYASCWKASMKDYGRRIACESSTEKIDPQGGNGGMAEELSVGDDVSVEFREEIQGRASLTGDG